MQKRRRTREAVIERIKALPGVCSEKKSLIQGISPFLPYCMQEEARRHKKPPSEEGGF
jgi:hypothetical protein